MYAFSVNAGMNETSTDSDEAAPPFAPRERETIRWQAFALS